MPDTFYDLVSSSSSTKICSHTHTCNPAVLAAMHMPTQVFAAGRNEDTASPLSLSYERARTPEGCDVLQRRAVELDVDHEALNRYGSCSPIQLRYTGWAGMLYDSELYSNSAKIGDP